MTALSRRLTLVSALWLGLSAFCRPAAVRAEDAGGQPAEVRALSECWKAAVEELDAPAAISPYAEDFLLGGTTRSGHWRAYLARFERIRKQHATLSVQPLVQNVEFWKFEGDSTAEFADVDLAIRWEEQWAGQRRACRMACPLRLRREGSEWKACGDQVRTQCALQVGYDGRDYVLTLTARSAWPSFPSQALVKGPGLKPIRLRKKGNDALGHPYVTETAYVATKPAVGLTYMFQVPYKNGSENIARAVRGAVDLTPAILEPAADAAIAEWPLTVRWQDVSASVKDFSNYEVHVRRLEDNAALYVLRSIPADQTEVTVGATKPECAALSCDRPCRIEVYALDMHGNYSVARTAVRLPAPAESD